MDSEKVYRMKFSSIYPLLVNKAVKKGRTGEEVSQVISWLTGYSRDEILKLLQWYFQSHIIVSILPRQAFAPCYDTF